MRTFLIPLTIIGLMAGASFALAQDHDRGGPRGGEQHGGPRGGEPRGGEQRGGPAMSGPREHRDAPAMRAAPPANAMRSNDNDRRDNRAIGGPDNSRMRGPDRNDMRGPGNAPRPDFNRPDNRPNNAMRGGPRRDFSNVRNFHQNFRATRRFHAPAYRRPPGWYARRWGWGEILPIAFWPRNYWITDFYIYDLPPPPFGAVWVRVGDDALLIDQDTGEIIEVDYGIFY
ncbi:MAG TPA: RcnB family protein [Rhizomicrobium sp.]|jgi:Ni/Co efflux regulator RcnB|nr:RcnB family protein [Rhizomicrobium sp.]